MKKIGQVKLKVLDYYNKNKTIILIMMILAISIFPMISKDEYIKGIVIKIMMFGILASALNVINGYSGMFCLGIAGMMCIGAYTEAILATRFNISFWLLLPLAGLFAAVVGVLVSLPTMRLSGIYFSVITMGLSEIIRILAQNWTSLTGGAMGIKNIPHPSLFGFKLSKVNHYYFIVLFLLILCLISIKLILESRIGRAWLSIREDEVAARSLGINILKYKAMNFFVASFWAGIAGAFMAPYYQFIAADMFTTEESFNILSMIIIGGQGTMIGPLIGSLVANGLSEGMRMLGDWRLVIYSIAIIGTMWFRPQGIAGSRSASLTGIKRRNRKSKRKDMKEGVK